MPTNDEIIKKYDLEGDGDLGIDVHEALKETRAEERTRIIRALGNELTKTYAEQRYIDGIRDVIAFIKEMK